MVNVLFPHLILYLFSRADATHVFEDQSKTCKVSLLNLKPRKHKAYRSATQDYWNITVLLKFVKDNGAILFISCVFPLYNLGKVLLGN